MSRKMASLGSPAGLLHPWTSQPWLYILLTISSRGRGVQLPPQQGVTAPRNVPGKVAVWGLSELHLGTSHSGTSAQ